MMKGMRGWVARLIPARERELVLRELDDLHGRRTAGGDQDGEGSAELWYLGQLLSFALRLRIEGLRTALRKAATLRHDLYYTARTLLRRPGFILAGVLTLGIGVGGVATVFGAANWVLLRDVPGVGDPDRLVWIRLESREDTWGGTSWGISGPDLDALRRRMSSLASLEAATSHPVHVALAGASGAERLEAQLVSPGYFGALRMTPRMGRFFDPAEHDAAGGPSHVVIGHDLWRRHWHGRSDALGATVEINGEPFTVIGVAPPGFRGAELPGRAHLWVTSSALGTLVSSESREELRSRRHRTWDQLVGRLREGADPGLVEAEANATMASVRRRLQGSAHSFLALHFVFRVYEGIGLDPQLRRDVERTLTILAGASLLLLLLAAANFANLGLTRAASRRGVAAIRQALGAGSGRVAAEPLLEGLMIGLAGAALGLGLVVIGEWTLGEARLASGGASLRGMALDERVALFTVVVSLAAGLLSGLAPALDIGRGRALDRLTGQYGPGAGPARIRSLLVVLQVALSATLVVGGGLLIRTMLNVNAVDLGYRKSAVTFSIEPGLNGHGPARSEEMIGEMARRLRQELGTEKVGFVYPSPLVGWRVASVLRTPDGEILPGSGYWISGEGFFRALGMERIAGDAFAEAPPAAGGPGPVALLNESMARAAFPDLDPPAVVGRPIRIAGEEQERTVVGVVGDARIVSPRSEPGPVVFRPYDVEIAGGAATFYVDAPRPAAELVPRVREIAAAVDPTLPIFDEGTVREQVAARLVEQRLVARLAAGLGLVGLLLAAIGLYGVLSYAVVERAREIGVRGALGASPRRIRSEILRRGLGLAGLGTLLAAPLIWASTRIIETRLVGVEPLDPVTYGVGFCALLGVAWLASRIPAGRATRVSPAELLRGL